MVAHMIQVSTKLEISPVDIGLSVDLKQPLTENTLLLTVRGFSYCNLQLCTICW